MCRTEWGSWSSFREQKEPKDQLSPKKQQCNTLISMEWAQKTVTSFNKSKPKPLLIRLNDLSSNTKLKKPRRQTIIPAQRFMYEKPDWWEQQVYMNQIDEKRHAYMCTYTSVQIGEKRIYEPDWWKVTCIYVYIYEHADFNILPRTSLDLSQTLFLEVWQQPCWILSSGLKLHRGQYPQEEWLLVS